MTAFPGDNPFAPLFKAVRDAVASEPLLPAHRGGYVAASQARLTTSRGLRNLVSRTQLTELVNGEEQVAWLAGDLTPRLRTYLRNEQRVTKIDSVDFVDSLDKQFLEAQSNGWIRRLYEFLHRERRRDSDLNDELEYPYGVPLIRLDDRTHVSSEYNAFLPTEPPSGFPSTVEPEVVASKPAREFLKSLGLSEPDLVDEFIREVAPRYRDQQGAETSIYGDDLQRVVDVFEAASQDQGERLVAALRETYFVRAVDAGTGETLFARPGDVYAGNRLRTLFEGVPGVLLASRPPKGMRAADVTRLLEACGASRALEVQESESRREYSRVSTNEHWRPYGVSFERRQRMRRRQGQESITMGSQEIVTNRSSADLQNC